MGDGSIMCLAGWYKVELAIWRPGGLEVWRMGEDGGGDCGR